MRKALFSYFYLLPFCAISQNAILQNQAQAYLDAYSKQFQKLFYADELAQWKMNTHIVKGDTASRAIADAADNALAQFTGSKENIDSARKYLALASQLKEIQVRQLNVILFYAAGNPATAGDIVDRRIKESNSLA
jgi:peptidyl-dipeptidase A